jgi:molybdopterin converting factor small subunit
LSEHIEVLVNDAVLGLTHTLDDPVRDGDRITLVGQYTGG